MNILESLKQVRRREAALLKELDRQRGNKRFLCGCGKRHSIKDCVAIQTHWYTSPSGCNEGDYWNTGEIQIVCPVTDNKNRILFRDHPDWSLRKHYDYSAAMQFSSLYPKLFKEIIQDYDKDKRPWWNNDYFDTHRETFHLHVKGVDKHSPP